MNKNDRKQIEEKIADYQVKLATVRKDIRQAEDAIKSLEKRKRELEVADFTITGAIAALNEVANM